MTKYHEKYRRSTSCGEGIGNGKRGPFEVAERFLVVSWVIDG